MLGECGWTDLRALRILDVGCGTGYWLKAFVTWGAQPENLFGVDLLSDRVAEARTTCAQGVHLECGNAESLGFPDGFFDVVVQATVLSSVLDSRVQSAMAREMVRVLRPGGFLLWYDVFVSNPRNRDVRGVGKTRLRELFPDCEIRLRRVTLALPVARVLARWSSLVCELAARVPWFRTHYLGVIRKQILAP